MAASAALTREQRLWRRRIIFSTFMGYGGFYFSRKVYGLVKHSLNHDLDWPYDSIALIWAAYLLAYMIGQFVNGYVGRRWGPRILLLGGLAFSVVCNIAFGLTSSYWTFMSFMVFNGLVQAAGWPGSVGGIAQWVRPSERGFIMGGWSTSYVWGNIGTKLIGSWLLGMALFAIPSWRLAFFGCTFISFLIWWLLFFWQRNKPQDVGLPPIVDINADEEGRAVRASNKEHVGFDEYLRLAKNPLIVTMGLAYFFVKFLRYALDSWLPTFLALQGMTESRAGLFSTLFDIGGILPCILIGYALDRYFNGNWAKLCFIAGVGLVAGYTSVLYFETDPVLVAVCFGLVGFMIYGPDTLLCGAASVAVAGEVNGVAVAGLVNGIGSIGPIIQELIIGKIMTGKDEMANIHATNVMAFVMSIAFALMMLVTMWRVRAAHQQNRQADKQKETAVSEVS